MEIGTDPAFARTPERGYYAVIFSARRTDGDHDYGVTAARMGELAAARPGYLGIESARSADGFGITVSYWESEEAIAGWKAEMEHLAAQERGIAEWYSYYELRVARVERSYPMGGSPLSRRSSG